MSKNVYDKLLDNSNNLIYSFLLEFVLTNLSLVSVKIFFKSSSDSLIKLSILDIVLSFNSLNFSLSFDGHFNFLGEIFGWETLTGLGKKRLRPLKRTSRMTKQEFTEYLHGIENRLIELGIGPLPEPIYDA